MKLLLANPQGEIFEHPELEAAAWNGNEWLSPARKNWIPLPEGSKLFTLPHRFPVGYNTDTGRFEIVTEFNDGKKAFQPWAVSAFMPPSYMRLLLPAYSTISDAPFLTQWAYTAVAADDDNILVPAVRVDESERWNPENFDDSGLSDKIAGLTEKYPDNRIIEHIAHCAANYHCFAAKNFFMGRWEAGLPTARKCNASCLGCLSLQTGDTPSSHQRIAFTPTPGEIAEIAVHHLENADDPLISFGQGCEGDPVLEWRLIASAIRLIRSKTDKGTIHFNTNGSIPEAVQPLAEAGMNSVRISLNSARRENYDKYFRPENYTFDGVKNFIDYSHKCGLFVHINLLIMPGFNDTEREIEAFINLAEETGINLLQLMNLNIDPEYYLREMLIDSPPLGMKEMWDEFKRQLPNLRYGYFNLQKERF